MEEEHVRFIADRCSVKPVKKDGEMSVELFTGIYSVPSLTRLFSWQALQESTFEVSVRRVSPEHAREVVRGQIPEGEGVEEELAT